jgi:WD40 repeat protein
MYERSTTGFYKALDAASETLRTKKRHTTSDTADASDPGQLIASIFDHTAQSRIMSLLREDSEDKTTTSPISTFTRDYAICCEPLSELASTSQAYCSLFWDPVGNWVVVAFKSVLIILLHSSRC